MEEYNNAYYISELKINEIHQLGYTGKGIKIAIIDSGCDYNHIELHNKIKYGINLTNENMNSPYDYMDNFKHGTAVTSEIVKIAPNSDIIIIKCLDKNGSGSVESINKGLEFAIKQNVDIVNMSIGSKKPNSDLEGLIKLAVEKNICVVAAAGNDGNGSEMVDEIHYPAYYYDAISVGSLTKDYKPSFFSASNDLIDLLAFGEDIPTLAPKNNYTLSSGTSQAAPIVTGILALMKQYLRIKLNREPKEDELYKYLINNTKEIDKTSRNIQGYGYVQLDNFINDLRGDK